MDCDSTRYMTNTAYCNYAKTPAPNMIAQLTTHKPRELKIIYTDYFSILVASVCQSHYLYHYQDYIVLTRDK